MTRISFLLLALATGAHAAITISDLSDETFYTNSVSFTIEGEAGFNFEADLNGQGYTAPGDFTIDEVGYHELTVTKRDSTTGDFVESTSRRFLVTSSERGSSERGLAPWIPRRNIASSDAEIDTGTLNLVTPAAFPANWPIPAVAKILGPDSKPLRLMVDANIDGAPIRLFRGAGSTHLPATNTAGTIANSLSAASLGTTRSTQIETEITWTTAAANISADTTWPTGSRVQIPVDMSIAAGVTLTIGAGSIIEIADAADITIDGTLQIDGTKAAPVTMTAAPGSVWGGCIVNGETHASYLFVTNGGEDDDWMSGSGFSAHRKEQATFLFDSGAIGTFADCYWIANPGQPLHNKDATITLDRCLIQRSPTVGQFNGGAVTLRDCHLVEFPLDSTDFADDDNDGIYFTTGTHELIDTVIGWTKDDGIDAGSGSDGTVLIEGCWFEACYHEGLALSGGGRVVTIRDTVAINNGQGIECGYSIGDNSPIVNVTNSVCIGNSIGWRFGDNYDWDYTGFLTVSGSISLGNDRNIWGYEWDSWNYRSESMDIQNNKIGQADPRHPNNSVWSASDGADLAPFMAVPGMVGIGFADPTMQRPLSRFGESIEFGLSSFNSVTSGLNFEIAIKEPGKAESVTTSGTLSIDTGSLIESFTPVSWDPEDPIEYVRVSISNPTGAQITTPSTLIYIDTPGIDNTDTLLPFGESWSYLDNGTDQGTAWRAPAFDDSEWPVGEGELGYGDGGEATELDDDSANYPTYYFRTRFTADPSNNYEEASLRLLRDDGGIVYLNGAEVLRSNMDPGEPSHSDFAADTVSNESTPVTAALDPALLLDGENVLAVEIHQANATSSDVSFDLELTVVSAIEPTMLLLPGNTAPLLVWAAPEDMVLERSDDLSTWIPASAAKSPFPLEIEPDSRVFYRLSPVE